MSNKWMKQIFAVVFTSTYLFLAFAAGAKSADSPTPLLKFKAGKLSQTEYTHVTRQLLIQQVAQQKAIVLQSGVSYRILNQAPKLTNSKTSKSKTTVKSSSSVEVKFKVNHPDGTLITDEFAKTPVVIPVELMISAWREVLLLVGAQGLKLRVFSPYDAAYGPQGDQRIPPYSDLIFDIEVISIPK